MRCLISLAILWAAPSFAVGVAEVSCQTARSTESDMVDTLSKLVATRRYVDDPGLQECLAKVACRITIRIARYNITNMISRVDDPRFERIDDRCGTSLSTLAEALRADSRWLFEKNMLSAP